MTTAVHHEWDSVTGLREKRLGERIDELSAQGLSAIQISTKLNLRIRAVWEYLQTNNPQALKQK